MKTKYKDNQVMCLTGVNHTGIELWITQDVRTQKYGYVICDDIRQLDSGSGYLDSYYAMLVGFQCLFKIPIAITPIIQSPYKKIESSTLDQYIHAYYEYNHNIPILEHFHTVFAYLRACYGDQDAIFIIKKCRLTHDDILDKCEIVEAELGNLAESLGYEYGKDAIRAYTCRFDDIELLPKLEAWYSSTYMHLMTGEQMRMMFRLQREKSGNSLLCHDCLKSYRTCIFQYND